MAEQVPAVSNVLDAIERRDWQRPAYHELREGRLVRWIDTPG